MRNIGLQNYDSRSNMLYNVSRVEAHTHTSSGEDDQRAESDDC